MNNTISVYKLLGLIKDGKAPKRIMFDTIEYKYGCGYYYRIDNEVPKIFTNEYNIFMCLNEEIEILEEDKPIIEKITLREFFDLIEKEDYPDYVIYYGEKYVKKMAGESLCDYISKDYSYLMLDIVNRNFLWNLLEEEIETCINRKGK